MSTLPTHAPENIKEFLLQRSAEAARKNELPFEAARLMISQLDGNAFRATCGFVLADYKVFVQENIKAMESAIETVTGQLQDSKSELTKAEQASPEEKLSVLTADVETNKETLKTIQEKEKANNAFLTRLLQDSKAVNEKLENNGVFRLLKSTILDITDNIFPISNKTLSRLDTINKSLVNPATLTDAQIVLRHEGRIKILKSKVEMLEANLAMYKSQAAKLNSEMTEVDEILRILNET